MTKHFFTTLIIIFYSLKVQSQNTSLDNTNKLFNFFKNNFDTTIVFYSNIPQKKIPNYYFIATYNSNTFLFTYQNPFEQLNAKYPKNVLRSFILKKVDYNFIQPDTNQFFLPKSINNSEARKLFDKIISKGLLSLKKDSLEYQPCSDSAGKEHYIYDDVTYNLQFISKGENYLWNFYALFFFDETCVFNSNRKKAITIIRSFEAGFK